MVIKTPGQALINILYTFRLACPCLEDVLTAIYEDRTSESFWKDIFQCAVHKLQSIFYILQNEAL
jgi:hypothetical protein